MMTETDQALTIQDVERAWDDQVKAADWYERTTLFNKGEDWNQELIEKALEDLEDATKLALELDNIYQLQYQTRIYDDQGKWHLCTHQQAFITYDEIDGTLRHCPTCGATLDENFNIVQVVKEIPY